MCKVYLLNVGANTGHRAIARSPLFDDGSFVFVSYPDDNGRPYPASMQPYVRGNSFTHLDPDWSALTYGDNCHNPRAQALKTVVEDDIFLFWALLWKNSRHGWDAFTGERHWCLIGALRVREILCPLKRPEDATTTVRVSRARENMHFHGRTHLDDHHYVFIGCTKHSGLFPKAVDLQVDNKDGLLFRTIRSADDLSLEPNGIPRWSSSLRTCRAIWDLSDPKGRQLAELASDDIQNNGGFNILKGI